uniref:Integrase catalytic domain-containing protein n=1 Tax=Nicotiana tabacum TaxID=4097 RepID=A0A1S3Y2D1_TOBAC|nr:PREDICTED: uncharacterized protein LOC107771436 [Nicotiana tabacum]
MAVGMPLCGDITNILVIVESGSSSHMVNDSSLLINAKTVGDKGGKFHLPTGSVAHVSHIGSASILKDLIVSNVMHIPDFKYNLLYVSKLTKEMRWVVVFFPDFFIFQELFSGQVRVICREEDGLYTWIFLLPTKVEAVVALRSFFAMIKNAHSNSVKFFRSDNGCEFFNSHMSELLQSLGIIHQSLCIHTPQQNGVAEIRHMYILEVARALGFQASVPLRFWGECVNTVVYIINRLPSTVLQKKPSFEIMFGHSPSLQHMRVFGCLGYVATVRRPDKFDPKAYPAVFLHMSSTSSTLFPVLDLTTVSSIAPTYASWSVPAQSIPSSSLVSPGSSDSAGPSIPLSPSGGLADHVTINDAPIITPSAESQDDTKKSIRVSRPPIWMKDYIVTSKGSAHCCYPISVSRPKP